MKNTIITLITAGSLFGALLVGCKKIDLAAEEQLTFPETKDGVLKDTDIPIGVAASFSKMNAGGTYAALIKSEFDEITFENELKNSSIVNNTTGAFNFSVADQFYDLATAGGLQVHGHTLAWHSQQAANYYKSYTGVTAPAVIENLTNPGFESGLTGWSIFNTNGATIAASASNFRSGAGCMRVDNPAAWPGSQWRVQVASILVPTTVGTQYTFSYWVRATAAGGSIRLSTADQSGGSAQYQGDQTIGTTYSLVSWTITANSAQTRFLFDMGQVANTYFIDDASFKQVVNAPGGAQIALKVDTALRNYITTTVTRYKGKIKSWDVVNEMFADGSGAIRNNSNTDIASSPNSVFVWSNYLGRDFGLKAFQYAAAADPAADLYINDYNLESSVTKLDSLIAYVAEIKGKGAKVDGIGTQMHIDWNRNHAGIETMFRKLAATGLKIKITELDVRINSGNYFSTARPVSKEFYDNQAAMYKYVVELYRTIVPKAQQAGITVWGLGDSDSWRGINGSPSLFDFPLLFNADYQRKPAYTAFKQALKGQ